MRLQDRFYSNVPDHVRQEKFSNYSCFHRYHETDVESSFLAKGEEESYSIYRFIREFSSFHLVSIMFLTYRSFSMPLTFYR